MTETTSSKTDLPLFEIPYNETGKWVLIFGNFS